MLCRVGVDVEACVDAITVGADSLPQKILQIYVIVSFAVVFVVVFALVFVLSPVAIRRPEALEQHVPPILRAKVVVPNFGRFPF
jgi:hypothetical protein